MSVEVTLDDRALRECSYCARTHSTLVDDGDGGWMHADPEDCRVVELRIAGMVVDPVALAEPHRVTRERWARDLRFGALADAELLAAGERHVTRAEVTHDEALAIAEALAQLVERRDRQVDHARSAPARTRRRAACSVASAEADRDAAAAALTWWVA